MARLAPADQSQVIRLTADSAGVSLMVQIVHDVSEVISALQQLGLIPSEVAGPLLTLALTESRYLVGLEEYYL